MNDDKITHLKPVPKPTMAMTEGAYVDMVMSYIRDNDLIELEGEIDDVELIDPEPGERRLVPLNKFETRMFAIVMHTHDIISDIVNEAQARTMDHVASMIRQQRAKNGQPDMLQLNSLLSREDQLYIMQLGIVNKLCMGNYEFSVRSRTQEYEHMIVVRKDFVAYTQHG